MSRITPDMKVRLQLTAGERDLLLELKSLPASFKKAIRAAAAAEPVAFTPDKAFCLFGYVGGEANRTRDKQRQHSLDALSGKIQQAMYSFADEVLLHPPHAKAATRGEPSGRRKPAPKAATKAAGLYQFKITLMGIHPPIWRRIQIKDCTLDKLHEHIQTAMGWTNSHLHQFEIAGKRYGDPDLLEEDLGDLDFFDSTATNVSQILPASGKSFRFKYEYDFGDSWEHEILFEGCPAVDRKAKYPLCVEGKRACPPEDCGGPWGYADLLEALRDQRHEQHAEMVEWIGEDFDPESFEPAAATKCMRKGLPDWRKMDDDDWL